MSDTNIIGVFRNETSLLKALRKLKSNKASIRDIYGPFADHDLLKEFTSESKLPYFSLVAGIFTILSAFAAIYYIMVIDYPLVFGGKPIFSFPPMVVVIYLLTILVTGGLSTLAFLGIARLFPGKSGKEIPSGALDDRFYLVMGRNNDPVQIKEWLMDSGADEIVEEIIKGKKQKLYV